MKNCICEYNDWSISETETGLVVDGENGHQAVEEVFRLEFPEYEGLEFEEIEQKAKEAGLQDYDYSGELDDCSAYVFWKVKEG